VEIPCDVYAKRETEDRPGPEPFEHRNGRVTLQEAKRRTQDLCEWRIRDPAPVGRAAADHAQRSSRLLVEPLPQLPSEGRLADAGLADDGQKPRSSDCDCPTILVEQTVELSLSPDEHRSQVSEAASMSTVELADQAAIDDAASSLRVDRCVIGEVEGVEGESFNLAAETDLTARDYINALNRIRALPAAA